MNRLGFFFLLATLGAVATARADSAQTVAESNAARWNAALSERKLDDILSLYTGDAMLLQPDGKISRSASQIREFWRQLVSQGEFAVDVVDVHSETEHTIVTTTTLSEIKHIGSTHAEIRAQFDGVLYNVLERQADGTWKARIQRWSTSSTKS